MLWHTNEKNWVSVALQDCSTANQDERIGQPTCLSVCLPTHLRHSWHMKMCFEGPALERALWGMGKFFGLDTFKICLSLSSSPMWPHFYIGFYSLYCAVLYCLLTPALMRILAWPMNIVQSHMNINLNSSSFWEIQNSLSGRVKWEDRYHSQPVSLT